MKPFSRLVLIFIGVLIISIPTTYLFGWCTTKNPITGKKETDWAKLTLFCFIAATVVAFLASVIMYYRKSRQL